MEDLDQAAREAFELRMAEPEPSPTTPGGGRILASVAVGALVLGAFQYFFDGGSPIAWLGASVLSAVLISGAVALWKRRYG
jgi:hypothetical protein